MHYRMDLIACATALGLVTLIAGCSKTSPNSAEARTSSAGASDDIPDVLAKIGDQPVTMADVRAQIGNDLDRLDFDYKRNRSRAIGAALEQILQNRVIDEEARKQGKTIEELVMAEAGGSYEPSEIEVSAWYNENQARTGGRPLDQLKSQIADLLRRKKREAAADKLQARLNKERQVAIMFKPYRLSFNNENAPTLGKPGAPVTVVEFSDFQCPFCRSFAPNLHLIEKQFGDKVQVVYRQYPIPSLHPFAAKAAEASLCANEQGKFWALHDLMFVEQSRLSVSDLKDKARRLGMNGGKFDSCLDSGKYVEQVQRDIAEGARSGITGTPAIFVNGIEVPGGAVPLETVAAAIQHEIDQSSSATTKGK
jgi:protein-disulfide isomerase